MTYINETKIKTDGLLDTLPILDARLPNWHLDQLDDRPCPFCMHFNEALFLRPDKLPVAFCCQCGLWYVSKLPDQKAIKEYYDGYWHKIKPTELTSRLATHMHRSAKKYNKYNFQLQRLSTVLGGLKNKKILEIGSGLGSFLLQAKYEGADVVGIDLAPEACKFVTEQLNIQSYNGDISEYINVIGKVDAIILNDLIEHLTDPYNLIASSYDILQKGGLLHIWTPNGGAAGSDKSSAVNWAGFRIDLEHFQYMSSKTIAQLVKHDGWIIEHLETLGFPILKGIQAPPCMSSSLKAKLKQYINYIPGCGRLYHTLGGIISSIRNPLALGVRGGNYHLFTILRKT